MVALGVEFWCLLGDAALVALFYKFYKSCHQEVTQVKEAPSVRCHSELRELLQKHEGNVAYMCMEGVASPVSRVLRSQYQDEFTGVVQKLVMIEHKSKRTQGFWADVKKVLRDTVNTVPFVMSLPESLDSSILDSDQPVHVVDPTSASLLIDNLTETYDSFRPETSTLFSRGMDRLFGDVTKGIQETESMLPVGASLLGIGKVVVDSSKITLMPPTTGARYILTTLSKTEVLKALESRSTFYKVLVGVFGALGLALLVKWCRKFIRNWKLQKENARLVEELETARLQRISRQRQRSGSNADDSSQSVGSNDQGELVNCVICLTEGRDVILLNCGHICVCSDCAQALPLPRKCPICRSQVQRILPVYNV